MFGMNMKPTLLLVLAGGLWLAQSVRAAGDVPPLLYAAEGAEKIIRYGTDGKVAWEYPAEMSRDVWALPNNNVLFCFNQNYDSTKHDNPSGVMEVTPDKRVVFAFSTTGQVWSCQRMADGNTFVAAASQGKLLVVSPEAKVIRTIQVRVFRGFNSSSPPEFGGVDQLLQEARIGGRELELAESFGAHPTKVGAAESLRLVFTPGAAEEFQMDGLLWVMMGERFDLLLDYHLDAQFFSEFAVEASLKRFPFLAFAAGKLP
jgi:hypothetical protein